MKQSEPSALTAGWQCIVTNDGHGSYSARKFDFDIDCYALHQREI